MTESDQGLILSILSEKFSDFFVGFSDFLKKILSFEKCRPMKKERTVKILKHIKFLKLPNAEGGLVKKKLLFVWQHSLPKNYCCSPTIHHCSSCQFSSDFSESLLIVSLEFFIGNVFEKAEDLFRKLTNSLDFAVDRIKPRASRVSVVAFSKTVKIK